MNLLSKTLSWFYEMIIYVITTRVKPYSEERSYFCQIWMVNDKFVDGRDTEHPVPGIPSLTRAVIETRGQRGTISLKGNQEHLVVFDWPRNQQKLGLKIVIDWSWSCDHPREIFLVDIYINDLICIYNLNKTVKISLRKRSLLFLKQKHFKFTYLWVATAIVVIAHIVWNTERSVAMEIIVTPTKRLQVQNSMHNSLLLIK